VDWGTLLLQFFYSAIATGFFALIFHAPYKTIPFNALAGGAGWVLWQLLGEKLPAFFIVTVLLTVWSECAARWMKKPATLFTHVAIIPLIPGVGLYRTMTYFINGQVSEGLALGAETLVSIGIIAMAIGFTSLMFRWVMRRKSTGKGISIERPHMGNR
jgi:uncharacterized membrane protein YjjB (DUF3815 family)